MPERIALWESHGRKCVYCEETLTFKALEIDHIVPEASANNLACSATLLSELQLDNSFDILGFENLVPACRSCNGKKQAKMLPIGVLGIILATARDKSLRVHELIGKYTEQGRREVRSINIIQSINNGYLTVNDLSDVIKICNSNTVKLSRPIDYIGRDSIFEIDMSRIDELYTQEIAVNGERGEKLRLVDDEGGERYVNTLQQYQQATAEGYYALTNAEIKNATYYFESSIDIFKAIKDVRVPDESYISDPLISVNDIEWLPSSILMSDEEFMTDDPALPSSVNVRGMTVKELVEDGSASVRSTATGSISIECGDYGTNLFEVFRGDVNFDGLEDIVVYWVGYPLHGTMRIGGIRKLTRRSRTGMFEELVEVEETSDVPV